MKPTFFTRCAGRDQPIELVVLHDGGALVAEVSLDTALYEIEKLARFVVWQRAFRHAPMPEEFKHDPAARDAAEYLKDFHQQ